MSIAYQQVGRTSQKHRTRTALVAAARELLAHHIHHHHADGIAGQFAQILPERLLVRQPWGRLLST
jgi:hypothetical protein